MFCLIFNSYIISCSLTCPYVKACWKGENSHGRPQTFFQGRGQRHHITYIILGADVPMQIYVHKTLYCFYTTKKMHHDSTRSICIYFEIFFNWSCIRVCHKSVLSVIRYSVCWIGANISLWTPPWASGGGGKAPWFLKMLPKNAVLIVSSGKKYISSHLVPTWKFLEKSPSGLLCKNASNAHKLHTTESEMDLNYQQPHWWFCH